MNREEIEKAIEHSLAERKKHVVNHNALNALFGVFGSPTGSLGKIFLGKEDALATEKLRIQQNVILDLLCQIDDAISQAREEASKRGVDWIVISGEIEAYGVDAEEVTGARITPDAGLTEIKPGTHIKASGTRVRRVTGLEVGERPDLKGG